MSRHTGVPLPKTSRAENRIHNLSHAQPVVWFSVHGIELALCEVNVMVREPDEADWTSTADSTEWKLSGAATDVMLAPGRRVGLSMSAGATRRNATATFEV